MSERRYSICLYGTSAVGFTYLLSDEKGLVATSGPGSDFGIKGDGRGPIVITRKGAVRAALEFVPDGARVNVHAPGTGKIVDSGTKAGPVLL